VLNWTTLFWIGHGPAVFQKRPLHGDGSSLGSAATRQPVRKLSRKFHSQELTAILLLVGAVTLAAAQDTAFQLDPGQTSVKFTLADVLHTVRGSFKLKRGALQFDPGSGKITGEIVVDATSGDSGNGMRDRKMHKEVLESLRYPEIAFRPDRIEGAVANQGTSSVMVHGIFSIHGADREITVPAQIDTSADHWTAIVHFTIPYQKWGMKNPSTLFLKVSDSVQIDLTAAGNIARATAHSAQ
jgi:polyisoprenoid-binding protein YceI